MDLPSGDQAIGEDGGPGGLLTGSDQVPDVRRFVVPPSAGTIHSCVGVGACCTRKSLFPISKPSSPFFIASLFSGTSSVRNARALPSGRHANCCTPLSAWVTCSGSPPFIGRTKI